MGGDLDAAIRARLVDRAENALDPQAAASACHAVLAYLEGFPPEPDLDECGPRLTKEQSMGHIAGRIRRIIGHELGVDRA